MGKQSSVDQLNSFLRGEMAAVETYTMALAKLPAISTVRDELLACLKSHRDRVMMLQDAIVACGGTPSTSSGPWGVFAKTVEGGAKLLGEKAALAALEEGEDHGLEDYEAELDDLDPTTQRLVRDQLLPMQHTTHDRVRELKQRVS